MIEKNKKPMSNLKFWVLVWGLGIAGQLCWNIENQWFSNFVYAKIAPWPEVVTAMVALSAIATCFSTFFFGTLSDRLGSRRKMLWIGYIMWGIFTIIFGLTEFMKKDGNANSVVVAAVFVVVFDSIMSFFGSMGSDAGFSAWTNDMMNDKNRGGIGAAVATQPVICTIAGTVLGGVIVGADNSNYMLLFIIFGAFVILVGILAFFFMQDSPDLKPVVKGKFWQQFASVFNFKKFFKMKELVWVNIFVTVFFIGFNCYFSYMGIYMINYLGFGGDMMGYIEGVGLVIAMLLAIPATILINKNKAPLLSLISVISAVVGCLVIYLFVSPENVNTASIWNPWLLLGVFFVGAGYVVVLQASTVWAKQLYPKDSHGQFEGVRILFFVLLPMIAGPVIANPLINKFGFAYTETYNTGEISGMAPNGVIFLAGAIATALSVIPLCFAWKCHDDRINLAVVEGEVVEPSQAEDGVEETLEQVVEDVDGVAQEIAQ